MKKCFAIIGILLVANISFADEPPQCNLPGWPVVKESLTTHVDCRCGVSCPCADSQTIAAKPVVKQSLPVQTRREYFYQGRQLMYRDVAAAPQMDCSNGTCRVR